MALTQLDSGVFTMLYEQVELELQPGWQWIVRSTVDEQGPYFANICPPEGDLRFSCYGPSPYRALLGSFALYKAAV